jgi:hypothetical protein
MVMLLVTGTPVLAISKKFAKIDLRTDVTQLVGKP